MAQLEDLDVWRLAMEIAEEIYRWTKQLPKSEEYSLSSQLRRSAVSIPSNIAEGWGRGIGKSQAQFYRIARGSLMEVKTQSILAYRLEMTPEPAEIISKLDQMGRQLHALIASVERRLNQIVPNS